jgi:hypothetical protein
MGRLFFILAFLCPAMCRAQIQSFTFDDLLTLSSLSPQNFDSYIVKKGFSGKRKNIAENTTGFTFFEKKSSAVPETLPANRSIDLYKKDDTWCIAFHTSSSDENINGLNCLKKMNFFFAAGNDTCMNTPLLFQKRTITVQVSSGIEDGYRVYTFLVKKKEVPDPVKVRYAEDLLKFDSHEYLVSCFGENNVKRDVYIFTERESKKCSVLFPNSNEQAVFIWDDENNFRNISYILISGTLSTPNALQYSGSFSQNKWILKNGIYPGMRIGDLLKINENDFTFYGNQSEFSLMVEPKVTGNVNFKRIGIGLNCFNCERSVLMDKTKVSALDAVNNNLALHVSCIMISP